MAWSQWYTNDLNFLFSCSGAKNAQCDNGLNEVHEFVIEDRYNEKPNNFKSNEMAVSIDHYVVDEDIAKH